MSCPAGLAAPVIAARPGPPGAIGQHPERRSNEAPLPVSWVAGIGAAAGMRCRAVDRAGRDPVQGCRG
jgi:hypothetical protein